MVMIAVAACRAAAGAAAAASCGALFAAAATRRSDCTSQGARGCPPEAIAAALDTATIVAVTEAFALAIIADGRGRPIRGWRAPRGSGGRA